MKKSYYGVLAKDHPMNKMSLKEKIERVESGKMIARAMVANLAVKHNIKVITVLSK